MSTPTLYCPGCGLLLQDVQPLDDITEDRTIYDCYCEACGWSGDIRPDHEATH